ncbi:MAG: hypothetical protein AAFO07_31620 [Bacteroidota bacterium]
MSEPKILVLVFRTSIKDEEKVEIVKKRLSKLRYVSRITFDLEDIDNILRIEAFKNVSNAIIQSLRDIDLYCEELE